MIVSIGLVVMLSLTGAYCSKDKLPTLRSRKSSRLLHPDFISKLHNPYPGVCEKQRTVHLFNMCVLQERWDREVRISQVYRRSALEEPELPTRFDSDRQDVPPSRDQHGDCLYNKRIPRPFPGQCRTKNTSNTDTRKAWERLWNEVHGDFSYMYDYVLWDESFPNRKENQLWYLVRYLRTLALLLPNPVDVSYAVMMAAELRNRVDQNIGASRPPELRSRVDRAVGVYHSPPTEQTLQTLQTAPNNLNGELRENPSVDLVFHQKTVHSNSQDADDADIEDPPIEYLDSNLLDLNNRGPDVQDQQPKSRNSKTVIQNGTEPPKAANGSGGHQPANEDGSWVGWLSLLDNAVEFGVGLNSTSSPAKQMK